MDIAKVIIMTSKINTIPFSMYFHIGITSFLSEV